MKTKGNKSMNTLTSTLALAFFIGAAVVVTGLVAPETAYARGTNLTPGACMNEYARNPGGTEPLLNPPDISYNEETKKWENITESPGNVRERNRASRGTFVECLPSAPGLNPANGMKGAPVRPGGVVQQQAVKKVRLQKKTPPRKIGIVQPQTLQKGTALKELPMRSLVSRPIKKK